MCGLNGPEALSSVFPMTDTGRQPKQYKTRKQLVHDWDSIKNINVHSFLVFSTHKHIKCYPTMAKECISAGFRVSTLADRAR